MRDPMALAHDIEHAKAWISMNPAQWERICNGACIPVKFNTNTYFINLVRNARFLRSKLKEQGFAVRNEREAVANEFGPFDQSGPHAPDSRTHRYVPELLREDASLPREGSGGDFGGAGATGSWDSTDSGGSSESSSSGSFD